MAVTKYCQAGPPEGSSKTSSVNAYRLPLTVWSDNAEDEAGTIIFYIKNTAGYLIGSSYVQPTYTDTFSVVKRIEAKKRQGSADPWVWDCHVIYEPAVPNTEQEDENGQLTENPLDWRWDISSAFIQEQLPVWAAYNVDAYPKAGAEAWRFKRTANTLASVVNSAGTTLDPPLMKNRPVRVLRISGNLNEYQDFYLDDYINRINQFTMWYSKVLFDNYGFGSNSYSPWEVLCSAALATFQRANNIGFWRYTYEFQFKKRDTGLTPYGPSAEGDGWLDSVLDMGIARRALPGAPDGKGGTIPDPGSGTGVYPGLSETSPVKDIYEKRVPEKVLFDGSGLPLSNALGEDEVWFRYRKHEQADFSGIPLDIWDLTDPQLP